VNGFVLRHVEASADASLWPYSEGFLLIQDAAASMLYSCPSSRRHRRLKSLGEVVSVLLSLLLVVCGVTFLVGVTRSLEERAAITAVVFASTHNRLITALSIFVIPFWMFLVQQR
jgi:hypothetical protein